MPTTRSTQTLPTTEQITWSTTQRSTTKEPAVSKEHCPCVRTDHYHVLWVVPANETLVRECHPGARGNASWTCDYVPSVGCRLRTEQPDFTHCRSIELEHIADNVTN